jgi:tRNA G10  N-methylase Trm11
MRLPKPRREAKARGAISHELSAVLVAASGPEAQDVFLDPFGGSASFVTVRLEYPARKIWYSDIRLGDHRPALEAGLRRDHRVQLLADDALRLPSIPDGSVDVIVTDPPWGEHETLDRPYPAFAAGIAASFARVLHPRRGRYVVLINRDNAAVLRQALSAAGIAPDDSHEILVNGHPATVLVRRRARNRPSPGKAGPAAYMPGHAGGRTSTRTAR